MDDVVRDEAPLRERHYMFVEGRTCNMCGADAEKAKILGVRLDRSQGRQPRDKRGIAVSVCRCFACGLVFANPQPVPRSLADHYGVPPELYWKNVKFDPEPGYFGRQVKTAKRLLDFQPGMKALDIGVGLGKATRVMSEAGFDVFGIEPSEPFHRKAIELGVNEKRVQLVSVEDGEFEEGAFDFVTFGAVLEHLYDPSRALEKAMHWLRPGGIIQVEVPNSNHLITRIINAYNRVIGTNFVTNISPMHSPFHLYEFTLDSFNKNGERLNYKVEEHWFEVCSIYHMPIVLHPLLRTIMKRNDSGMQLTVFLRKKST
jgi:2-polyprenyl-3-methyl-5-hydroxy-6-metoxy-1,4-benzoquinol methylase